LLKYPKNFESTYISGLAYLKDGQVKKSIEYLSAVYKIHPKNFELVCNLGFAYHETGELDLAEKFYKEALDLNPNYIDAYYNLHAIQIDRGESYLAIASLKKIIKLNSNDLDGYFMLAFLLDYLDHKDQSLYNLKEIEFSSALIDARIEAWNYLRKFSNEKLKLTGSSIKTFEVALNQAKLDGLILELGVRNGNSINQLAKLVNQTIFGFDSFEGLLENWHNESRGSYSTKGVMPDVEKNVILCKGWFDQTLPIFLREHEEKPIKFLNIDCDTYQSTRTALDILNSRIQSGTIIVFDEYIGNQHWKDDEFRAFQEAVNKYKWKYEYITFSFFTKQVTVKIL
jgi:tetratricopeptide (TPR) repeat protein